jgi:hypothetical protein
MINIYKDHVGPRGLFAYVWCIIDVLKDLKPEDQLFVDLRYETPYFDTNYHKTNNTWEYYFKQPFGLNLNCYQQQHNVIKYNWERVANTQFGIEPNAKKYSLFVHEERRLLATKLIRKYIKFQDHIQAQADKFYADNFKDKKILGVHYRGGQHYITGHAANQSHLMNYEYYFSKIDENLENFDSVFLISFEKEPQAIFKQRYGDRLFFYNSEFLGTSKGDSGQFYSHPGTFYERTDQNYKIGETSVLDCILLSMCDKKIVTQSNLGFVSVLLNDNPYEFIDGHITYS